MIGLLTLLAAQATTAEQFFRTPEELGEVPEFCVYQVDFGDNRLSDGADADEFYRLARCLAIQYDASEGGTRADLERGIGYFRELIAHVERSSEDPASNVRTLHSQILRAYGRFGHNEAMLAEAARLASRHEADPDYECDVFGRLALLFEMFDNTAAAAALTERFGLRDCVRYIPPYAGQVERPLDLDWEVRIGNSLLGLGESSLQEPNALGTASQVFRLVVLPWRRPSFSVRVEFAADGSAVMHLATGQDDYRFPYSPVLTRSRNLSAGEARDLRSAINVAGVPTLSPRPGPHDGDYQIVACGDGTSGVFELLTERSHRMAYRHGCDVRSPELAALIRTTFGLLPEGFTEVDTSDLLVPGYGNAEQADRPDD